MSDWDDLFGDSMSVEDDDLGVQSPNATSRRASNSAMSMSGSANTPQPAPATLFRAPQPRTAPPSAPTRPASSRALVKKFADVLKLSKDNQEVLQKMYDNTLPGEEYLGTLSYLVFICQESKVSSGSKWVAGRVIRDAFKEKVGEFIFRADLQAYSKTVAEDHTTMVQSLEVLTFNYVKQLTSEYIDEHGPGDYVAGEACVPGSTMYLFVKDSLKNQRSKVRSALLTEILGVSEGSGIKVPTAKTMVLKVAQTFQPSLRGLEDEDVLFKLGRGKVKRMIFMQYVTAYYYHNQSENKKRCQWTLMDEALSDLRARPESDTALYFDQIARDDRETFTGKRTWVDIKASAPLPPPFVEQVLARAHAALAGGSSGNGSGSGGTRSGNQGTVEGFEDGEANPSQH
ncbi:hypothetical protein DFH28DRAFT_1099900 [Melampsora americana]|nr:hypothetical protein DFH28DRAFT_1099900 [Melampsora americana]